MLSSRLWAWPLLTGILGTILGVALNEHIHTRRRSAGRLHLAGRLQSAASMITFIASTVLTVLTTTISMTLIVLQVASGNFSHQLLRDFISSRAVRGILGVYVGLFTYTVMVGRSIDADDDVPPQLAMTVAMIGIFVAVATFVWQCLARCGYGPCGYDSFESASRVLASPSPDGLRLKVSDKDPVERPDVPEDATLIRSEVLVSCSRTLITRWIGRAAPTPW